MRNLVFLLLVLAGCSVRTTPAPHEELAIVASTRSEPSVASMLADLAGARLVCFGEAHDRASDHTIEAMLFDALAARSADFELGLEMVESDRQAVLDRFVAGEIPLDSLDEALDWDASWGFDFTAYAPIFDVARARHRRIVALNARREVVRRIVTAGVDVASSEFPGEVPTGEVDPGYAAFVRAALSEHPNLSTEQVDRFVAAQRTWDRTMGRRAAETALAAPPARILVLAGAMHCAYSMGIPAAASLSGDLSTRIVLGHPIADLPRLDDRPVADYVLALRTR